MTSRVPFARRFVAALVSALAVAAITHIATLLLFFSTNGAVSAQLRVISDFFLLSSLALFVLLAVAAIAGAYWRWYTALGAGILAAVVAALAGTVVTFTIAGNAFTPAVIPSVLETLTSNNLIFIVAAAIATPTAGLRIWRALISGRPVADRPAANVALVRLPASNLADGELTHLQRETVDAELADTQWDAYVAALESEGFTVVEIEAAASHADSAFIEDTVVMVGRTAVIASPGAESRRGEVPAVVAAIPGLSVQLDVATIELPGTLEGGDVLEVDGTFYVGRSGRTNAEGIRQFRAIANAQGHRVVTVPVSRVLHLKSAVTALPDGTVIGFAAHVEHPELFPRFLAVPEESGAAVVVLSKDSVLMAASAPGTKALLEDLGYRVVTVDISEFEKLEGSVTCLSVRIR